MQSRLDGVVFPLLLLILWQMISPHSLLSSDIPTQNTGIIIKDGINIRTDATVNSPSLGILHKGEKVSIVGERFNWYKIILPSRFECYVSTDYLDMLSAKKALVTASTLNLRAGPSLHSPIIGKIKKDAVVKVVKKDKEWSLIEGYPFLRGWVHKKFIEIVPARVRRTKPAEALKSPLHPNKKIVSSPPTTTFTATGVLLKMSSLSGCPANYRLKNGYIVFFLHVPDRITEKGNFEGKKVLIHGIKKIDSCTYIDVNDISF